MKATLIYAAVLSLITTGHAGTITLDVVGIDHTASVIQIVEMSGAPPVGIALIVDAGAGSGSPSNIHDVEPPSDPFFNVFIDFAHTFESVSPGSYTIGAGHPAADPSAPGVATLPGEKVSICVAELNAADANSLVLPIDLAIVIMDNLGDICLSEDLLRGGVVDIHGQPVTVIGAGGECYPVGGCCDCCPGEIADSLGILGSHDGYVGFGDLNALIQALAPTFEDVFPNGPDPLFCADIADQFATLGNQDGVVGFGDLNALIVALAPTFADRDCVTDPLPC